MKYRNNRGTILQIQFRTFLRYHNLMFDSI
ncbi:uncharacterized protein [Drosophila kikkawai]|uniref:Uncharacterized protein n=1 Tax=Drosophila kikkawai TaxID=30033 RepID=A0ABM4GGP5_DROKI